MAVLWNGADAGEQLGRAIEGPQLSRCDVRVDGLMAYCVNVVLRLGGALASASALSLDEYADHAYRHKLPPF